MLNKITFLLLFLGLLVAQKSQAQFIDLTEQEKEFIKTRSSVKLGIDPEFKPFIILDEKANKTGFEVDHLSMLSQISGLKFELVTGTWSEMVTQALNHEIDGLAYSSVIPSRNKKLIFSKPYLRADQVVYSNNSSKIPNAENLSDFKNRRIGVQKNDAFNTSLAKDVPNSNVIFYATNEQLINALVSDQVDHIIAGANINYIANKRSIPNIIMNYVIIEKPCELVYSVRNDQPLLKSIIDKAIEAIPMKKKQQLMQDWLLPQNSIEFIHLTNKEKAFIEKHKDIVFGGVENNSPYLYEVDGQLYGFEKDLLTRINRISGLNIQLKTGKWPSIFEDAKNRKTDGLIRTFESATLSPHFLFSSSYVDSYIVIYARKGLQVEDIKLSDLKGEKVGLKKGFKFGKELLKQKQISATYYDSTESLVNAITTKEIDYIVDFISLDQYLVKNSLTNIQPVKLLTDYPIKVVYSSRKDWPELQSIINKCLDAISLKDRIDMLDKWINFRSYGPNSLSLSLTEAELKHLKTVDEIKVGFIEGFMPFGEVTSDGRVTGMVKDYMDILTGKLGISVDIKGCESSDKMYNELRENKIDFALFPKIIEAKEISSTSISMLESPFALIMSNKDHYISNLEYSKNLTVGIIENDLFENNIKRRYPNIQFIQVPSIEKGYDMVSEKAIDGFMTLLPIGIFNIKHLGRKDLMVGSVTDLKVEMKLVALEATSDHKELLPILNKGIAAVSGSEMQGIMDKWYSFKEKESIDYGRIISAVVGLLAVILIIFIWNRMLTSQIKKREETELELREIQKSQEMFVQAIELSKDYIFFTNKSGQFLYVNTSAREKFGLKGKIEKLHFNDILSVESASATQQLLDSIVSEEGMARVEGNVLHMDTREPTKVDSSIIKVDDKETGELLYYVNIGRDISEKNKLLNDLENAKKIAEESNRAKTDFLANMSHEIRTPLNGIIGMTELMSKLELNEEAKLYTKTISDSGNILLSLINNVLDISKIEAQKMSLEKHRFHLKSVLETVTELCKVNARKKPIEINYKIDPKLNSHFIGDRNKLTQVLLNLMGNAVKFTEKGSVTLSVSAGKDDKQLNFKIEDTGVGIAQEDIKKLFVKFYQTGSGKNSTYQGTGLGLVISKNIIELMGGSIKVESQIGQGTKFIFDVILEASKEELNSFFKEESEKDKEFKILIAEDNEINQLVMRKQFEGLGIKPEIVDDGTKVLEKLKNGNYGLIFMDLGMPNLDGLETTRQIRIMDIEQPIIIALTASAIKDDRNKCIEAGMDDYLSKPISMDKLESTIAKYSRQ